MHHLEYWIVVYDMEGNILNIKPLTTELDEIIINSKKLSQELTIGEFKKSKINSYFACGTHPWISARFFNIPLVIYENNLLLGRTNKNLLSISKKITPSVLKNDMSGPHGRNFV